MGGFYPVRSEPVVPTSSQPRCGATRHVTAPGDTCRLVFTRAHRPRNTVDLQRYIDSAFPGSDECGVVSFNGLRTGPRQDGSRSPCQRP
jgi:hypothetical protein